MAGPPCPRGEQSRARHFLTTSTDYATFLTTPTSSSSNSSAGHSSYHRRHAERTPSESSGTFPVSAYLVSQDLAIMKSVFSCSCAAIIPSVDPAPAFLSGAVWVSVSLHTRMTSRRREHDRSTSVTPMPIDVSCSETANSDSLGRSLFLLCAHVRRHKPADRGLKRKKRGRGRQVRRGNGIPRRFYSRPKRQGLPSGIPLVPLNRNYTVQHVGSGKKSITHTARSMSESVEVATAR